MKKAGRTVTVSGPIGSGKTTVARLLVAFLRTRGFGVELGEMPELDRTNLSKEPVAELLSDTMAPWWPVRVEVRSTDKDEGEASHMEVFRKASGSLVAHTPEGVVSVTRPCSLGDFREHRGVHMDLRVEDLQDSVKTRGRESMAQMLGETILTLIDAAVVAEAEVAEADVPR